MLQRRNDSPYIDYTADKYKEHGYTIQKVGEDLHIPDTSIDIVATKPDRIILIRCDDYNNESSFIVTNNDIKKFRADCIIYDKTINNDIPCFYVYAIDNKDILHDSAIYLMKTCIAKGENIKFKLIKKEYFKETEDSRKISFTNKKKYYKKPDFTTHQKNENKKNNKKRTTSYLFLKSFFNFLFSLFKK